MARYRTRVEKLIRRQRIRSRDGRSILPRRVGSFVLLTAKIFLVLAFLSGVGLLGFSSYRFLRQSDYFELKKLVITGVSDEIANDLCVMTQLKADCGINLLLLRPDQIRKTILKHSYIESASVTKRYPNALIVSARERKPVAIVASGALYLIDREGVVLDTIDKLDAQMSKFVFITGLKADQIVDLEGRQAGDKEPHRLAFGSRIPTKAVCLALDVEDCLKTTNPQLAARVSEIRIEGDDSLTLVLTGGIEVFLGAENFADRLAALDLVARKHGDFESLRYVDLRFQNQIVYKPRGS